MDLNSYLESLRLGRDILDVMIGGRSSIDTRGGLLATINKEETKKFISAYGYELDNPIDRAELFGIYHESLNFIRKYFLTAENPDGWDLKIPTMFQELKNIEDLFTYIMDKNEANTEKRNWTCSIIRVMHTIVHLDRDIRTDYLPNIQQQIFDRFYKEIINQEDKIFLGEPKSPNPIALVHFQTKPKKFRDSQILKLLHKEENVAEDIYDQAGVRFVTKTRIDSLRVMKYLRDQHLVITANIKPSRSRNDLVDPFLYRRVWREARSKVQKEILRSPGEVDAFIEQGLKAKDKPRKQNRPENPFSTLSYSAIQFTCRQLIKYKNPASDDMKKLRETLKKHGDTELQKYADRIDFSHLTREQHFFYPYEVQIMDLQSYEESQSGIAAHTNYKRMQIESAGKRVLGDLISRFEKASN